MRSSLQRSGKFTSFYLHSHIFSDFQTCSLQTPPKSCLKWHQFIRICTAPCGTPKALIGLSCMQYSVRFVHGLWCVKLAEFPFNKWSSSSLLSGWRAPRRILIMRGLKNNCQGIYERKPFRSNGAQKANAAMSNFHFHPRKKLLDKSRKGFVWD